MLEMIRRQAMARNAKRRKKSLKLVGQCTKYVKETLAELRKNAEICSTTPATHGVYEVFLFGNSYVVNLRNQTCSCGKYQISGIPCEHAYGAVIYAGLEVEDYVYPWFTKDMWQLTYENNIEPVRGPRFWMKRTDRLVVEPPEPKLPGRKKKTKIKKRIKGKHESPKKKKRKENQKLPRTRRLIHCWNCGEEGHNYLGCKIRPKRKPRNFDAQTEEATSSSQAQEHASGSSQGPCMISLTQPSQMTQ